ncbi:MBL fold metallo-hydrolase RNA specificity domain-containing protein [Mucilaginibacter aquariorum]|uniref:MBL fold metallo-hydrolase n=1 Tax=Mucilaginibacter aquariorum TaxID=2967225 RepID=A0ABT1T3F5_9SPHI|nr:MBL fold metallo-hydrolase [Mucilaginibacter aquariorum]MCQ6959140.1 MBL fold metallo-hydrolase [Mucilaginibacter aquariorum]
MSSLIDNEPGIRDQTVYLQSLGAAQTVTGSKHLLITPELNILIDCGLFQGIKSLREKNREPLPVSASAIDMVILTHAHLDHSGYIPLLVKNGYRKPIYMTQPTRDLAELILRDSAKLQEEDAEKANRNGYSRHKPARPLYTVSDAVAALAFFKVISPEETIRVNSDIDFTLYISAHIAGACSVNLNCFGKCIVFSGDIGRQQSELLPPPAHVPPADYVVMESTYGDRLHAKTDAADELAMVINNTVFNHGNILIPCFAVGRAQEVMHLIYRLKKKQGIPSAIPVFLDSPMAASAGKVLLHYPDWFTISEKECAQMFSGVTINDNHQHTQAIIHQRGSKIVLAASGMMTGGRVLEYLKHYIGDARNTIVIIGYQAEGTRGRALLNKAYEIKIHGQYYPVRAQVIEIEGLSAHADQTELLEWLGQFKEKTPEVYLVHGEPCAQEALRIKIKDELKLKVIIPEQYQKIPLYTVTAHQPANGQAAASTTGSSATL